MTWLPPSVRPSILPSVRPSTRPSSLPRRAAGSDGERSRGKFSNPPLHLCGSSSLPLFLCPVALPGRPRSYFCAFCSISAAGSGSGGEGRNVFLFFQPLLQKIFFSLSWNRGRNELASRQRQRDPGWVFPAGQGWQGRFRGASGERGGGAGSAPGVKTGGGGHSGIPAPVSLGAP